MLSARMEEIVEDHIQQLLSRAEEARAVAVTVSNSQARLVMLEIARCYQRLAECVAMARKAS